MAQTTENLGLIKPDKTDKSSVSVLNQNFQLTDDFAGEMHTTVSGMQEILSQLQTEIAELKERVEALENQ